MIVLDQTVLLYLLSTGHVCNFFVVFTVILSLFVQCVLLTYIQLYEFMLVVNNCMLSVSHENQWFGARQP